MSQGHDAIAAILEFWFAPGNEANWFAPPAEFDDRIRREFGALVEQALAAELDDWQDTEEGALALILLLDQFTRNLHRNTARAFDGDAKARAVARLAISSGFDRRRPCASGCSSTCRSAIARTCQTRRRQCVSLRRCATTFIWRVPDSIAISSPASDDSPP